MKYSRCDSEFVDGYCICCKSPVVYIANNTGLEEFEYDDYIYYCVNKGCPEHKGTAVFQDKPEWLGVE